MPLDNSAEFANHIPEAIRRQSMRADEIAREIGMAGLEPAPEPAPVEEPAPEPVVEEPAPPAPAPTPAPAVEPAPDYEARYNSLRGKYDAEIPSLRNEVANLQRLIAAMHDMPPATPQPAAAAPAPAATTVPVVIPKEDIDTYGQDLIDAVNRWVMPRFEARLSELENKFGHQVRQVETGHQQLHQQTLKERVMGTLDADREIGSIWREVNVDHQFLAWLNQEDPFYGVPRMQALQDAFARGDAVRCKRFFTTYIAEHTATHTPAPTPVETAPTEQADRPTLETMAAPGRPTGSAPNNSGAPEKRFWTRPQIAAFYRDVQKGVYANREAEKLRIEMDIIAAPQEGRVR